jgi:hypothetical protein
VKFRTEGTKPKTGLRYKVACDDITTEMSKQSVCGEELSSEHRQSTWPDRANNDGGFSAPPTRRHPSLIER